MWTKRSSFKLIVALIALGIALWMNSVYDKSFFSASTVQKSDEEFIKSIATYSYKDINDICDTAKNNNKIKYEEFTLDFPSPTPTESRDTNCPWGRGDNLAPRSGQLMARYEQVEVASLPEKAVACSLDITSEVSPKKLDYQDFFILILNGVVLSTDAEFLFKFFKEEKTQISKDTEVRSYLYDWSRVLGARRPSGLENGAGRTYCVGHDITLSSCTFSHTAQPRFELNDRLVQWLSSRSMGPGQKFTMVVTGDKDEKADCFHSGFKLKAKYGYVVN